MATAAPFSADFDRRQLAEVRRLLREVPRGVRRAMGRAIRNTTRKGRVEIVREIAADLPVKQSDLYKRGVGRRPVTERLDRKGGDVVGSQIAVSGRRLPLSRFQARQHWRKTKGGGRRRSYVSYRLRKGGGRQKLRDAFAETVNGHFGVYRRKGKARLPIVELFGPSVPQVALNLARVQDLARRRYGVILSDELLRAVDGLLSRRRAARG